MEANKINDCGLLINAFGSTFLFIVLDLLCHVKLPLSSWPLNLTCEGYHEMGTCFGRWLFEGLCISLIHAAAVLHA